MITTKFDDLDDEIKQRVIDWYESLEDDNFISLFEPMPIPDRDHLIEQRGQLAFMNACTDALETMSHSNRVFLLRDTEEFIQFDYEDGYYSIDTRDMEMKQNITIFLKLNRLEAFVGPKFHKLTAEKYKNIIRQSYVDRQDFSSFGYYNRDSNEVVLNFINGTLHIDIETEKKRLEPHHIKYKFLSRLEIEYNIEARSELWEEKVKQIIPSEQDRNYFQSFGAYAMIPGYNDWEVFLVLYGIGNNGKGTLLDTFSRLFKKVASTKLNELKGERGKTTLVNSDFLYGDESEEHTGTLADIKAIASGSRISVDEKYVPRYDTNLNIKAAFTMNNLNIKVTSEGDKRKLLALFLPNQFEGDEDDLTLKYQLAQKENMQGIANWFINKIPHVIKNMKDLKRGMASRTEEFMDEFSEPWEIFTSNYLFSTDDKDVVVLSDFIWRAHTCWAKLNGRNTIAKNKMGGMVRKDFKINPQVIGGYNMRGFKGLFLNEDALDRDVPGWREYKNMNKYEFKDYFKRKIPDSAKEPIITRMKPNPTKLEHGYSGDIAKVLEFIHLNERLQYVAVNSFASREGITKERCKAVLKELSEKGWVVRIKGYWEFVSK